LSRRLKSGPTTTASAPRRSSASLRTSGSFPERTSLLAAALRHPVVVGALLALVSGIFASLLIPSLTRVWQDRPRELALKRDLVARMSREATAAADGAVGGLEVERGRRAVFYDRLIKRWRLESSVIGSELTTYFPRAGHPASGASTRER
jgi:hypothetical protein